MARKSRRGNIHNIDNSWHVTRFCQLCDRPYIANNYRDRKTRAKKWKGLEICATCQYKVLPIVSNLIDHKVLKFRKKHR